MSGSQLRGSRRRPLQEGAVASPFCQGRKGAPRRVGLSGLATQPNARRSLRWNPVLPYEMSCFTLLRLSNDWFILLRSETLILNVDGNVHRTNKSRRSVPPPHRPAVPQVSASCEGLKVRVSGMCGRPWLSSSGCPAFPGLFGKAT